MVGLAIGPRALGLATYTEFVSSLAHLGVITLFFVVGLEFKLGDLANLKYAVIGTLGVSVPLGLGYLGAQASSAAIVSLTNPSPERGYVTEGLGVA